MPAPIISPLPPAPLTTDSRSTFNDKAFVFVGSLSQFVSQVNAVAEWIDLNGSDPRKNNLVATTDPTASDDSSEGYEPLSQWLNTTTGEVFICISAAEGAAIWQKGTLTADELGNMAFVNASSVGLSYAQLPNPSAISFARVNADNTVTLLSASDFRTAIGAGTGGGSVSSVGVSVPTGLQVANSPVTSSGTIAISFASGYSIPTTTKQGEWDSAYSDRFKWDGGSTGLVASTARTSIGASTVGSSFITTANPSAITYPRVNANNTVTYINAGTLAGELGVTSKLDASAVGVSVAQLVAGVVPSSQLPSYVDDVLEFANFAAFPVTGEAGKIYIALDTNRTYRWSGSTYVQIVASPGTTDNVTEGSTNLYFTQARVRTTPLTGFVAGVGLSAVLATDTVIQAFQKIQGWLNGLGNAATANLVGSLTDTTAGRVTTVGWMGLGAGVASVTDMTAIEVNINRIFRMNSAATGGNGQNAGLISLALDGTPTTGFIGMTLAGVPIIGRKTGTSGTPTWSTLTTLETSQNFTGQKTFEADIIRNAPSGQAGITFQQGGVTNGRVYAGGGGGTDVLIDANRYVGLNGVSGSYLAHNGSQKLNTTSSGVSVTGDTGSKTFKPSLATYVSGVPDAGLLWVSGTYTYGVVVNAASGGMDYHANQGAVGVHRWYTGTYNSATLRMTLDNDGNLTLATGKVATASLPAASTTVAGIVQLNDTLTSTSTTQAATANAVKTLQDGKAKKTVLVTVSTSTHNIDTANEAGYHRFTFSGAKSATVRPNSTHVLPTDGSWVLRNANTGNLTIIAGSGVTINVPYAGTLVLEPGMTVTLQKVGTDTYDLIGQTVAA